MSTQYLDKAGATYLAGKIKDIAGGKVDKVSGKGLSTNDFTTAYKTKLDGAAAASDVPTELSQLSEDTTHRVVTDTEKSTWNGKQNAITFNSTYNASTNKAATMADVPTALSDLSADATHRLVSDTEKSTWNGKQNAITFNSTYNASTNKAATMKDVNDAVGSITGISFSIVSTLPTTGSTGVIYLVANGSSVTKNIYDEYIWLATSKTYEKIGTTDVDLSGYVKNTDLVAITNTEIDAMFA